MNNEFDILISQIDEHNEIEFMLINKFKIKKLITISDNKEDIINFRKVFNTISSNCMLIEEYVEEGDFNHIESIFKRYKDKNILINLTTGKRINAFILFKLALENNIQSIYVDLLNKRRYVLGDNSRVIVQNLEDITIDNIALSGGNKIISDSCNLCLKDDVIKITNCIYNNLDLWNKYKNRLNDTSIFIHNYKDAYKLDIDCSYFDNEEICLLNKILDELKKMDCINYHRNNEIINVMFNNSYLKGFIFKSGTWLEILTNNVVNSIDKVDEVKNSVVFTWNEEPGVLRNELDVIAIKDSNLVCISCKDSEKYDEKALNELEVYSKRLGGERTKKVLVATKEPIKSLVNDRAKEMGIHIVILDKDIDKFKKKLSDIIG